jgi:hypothetical protein
LLLAVRVVGEAFFVWFYCVDKVATLSGAVPGTTMWSGSPPSVDDTARASTEHVFMLGNNRVVVSASNYGALRVRQDEGSPKVGL